MTEKERFVTLARTGRFEMTELCSEFGISRKTGHKYLQRYEAEGVRAWAIEAVAPEAARELPERK